MKLSPTLQYNLIFGVITYPLIVPIVIALVVTWLNPLWFRTALLEVLLHEIDEITNWRDNLPIIKYYRDKKNLFAIIKG